LQPHKAPGPDGIPSRLLRDMATGIAPILTLIFQEQGDLPDDGRTASAVSVHKKGSFIKL